MCLAFRISLNHDMASECLHEGILSSNGVQADDARAEFSMISSVFRGFEYSRLTCLHGHDTKQLYPFRDLSLGKFCAVD